MVEYSNAGVNTISLVAAEDSTITNVGLYSGRAEITRNFRFGVKGGHNKAIIAGLPYVLQQNSVRVEGRGNASIHDVIVSRISPAQNVVNENTLSSTQTHSTLKRKRDELQQDIATAKEVRKVLSAYLSSIASPDFDQSRLSDTLSQYVSLARHSDREILDLDEQLALVNEQIDQDQKKKKTTNLSQANIELPSWQVSVNIHSLLDQELQIDLKYVVYSADWSARYEIRVDTKTTGKPITVFYKAVVTQTTGESWDNVPLTLETATPSFGLEVPTLSPWRVKRIQPKVERSRRRSRSPHDEYRQPRTHSRHRERVCRSSSSCERRSSRDGSRKKRRRPRDSTSPLRRHRSRSRSFRRSRSPTMVHMTAEVLGKGGIVATFRVPGLVNVPTNGASHNFVIAEMNLDAELFWYAVPSVDSRAHIKGKIKNDSEYSFIPGPANIYLDGSFVATIDLPAVTSQETFESPLGFDPSIRFTYHPRERKSTLSGFMTKTLTQNFTQRITISITKSSSRTNIKYLKVVDRVPVCEDERIEVKVLSPNLALPVVNSSSSPSTSIANNASAVPSAGGNSTGLMLTESTQALAQILKLPIRVSGNIAAQWDGADSNAVDQSSVGMNGKFHWLVSVPPQGTIGLVLQFEVTSPEGLAIEA